ncbi:unnamed protein product, partial [Didymodactylos carnosus]
MTLPKIEHPSMRMNTFDRANLDVRGSSRAQNGRNSIERPSNDFITGRPLASELDSYPLSPSRQQQQNKRRHNSRSFNEGKSKQHLTPLTDYSKIPDNVEAVYGTDSNKVRLPIFGYRPDSTTSSYNDNNNGGGGSKQPPPTPSTNRIIIDELESTLREKVRTNLHDIRTKFKNADPEGNGCVSKEALGHIIAAIFGPSRQIGPSQVDKLLDRFGLKTQMKISFEDFTNSMFNGQNVPDWVRQSPRNFMFEQPKRTAMQMFLILKEKARTKHRDLVTICPALDGGPSNRIFKAQFYNWLNEMGYKMKDNEFDKLWDKFDTDGFHAVNSDKFIKRLTNDPITEVNQRPPQQSPRPQNQNGGFRSSYSDTNVDQPTQQVPQT